MCRSPVNNLVAAIAAVVLWVAVHVAVGEHKIDGGVVPAERGRLERYFAAADGGRLPAVEIADFAAFNVRGRVPFASNF